MALALALAILSSVCFGIALVAARVGLRTLDARSGAAISIPTATLLFVVAAPFALDPNGFSLAAALVFALVGLFFPAIVTLLTFRSNEQLGPTVTGAVSGTAPLFAILAAALLLGERIPAQAMVAALAIVTGVGIISWNLGGVRRHITGLALLWPLSGAVLRGAAQAGVKVGLLLWPSAFAASLIGYVVSSITVFGFNRLARGKRPKLTPRHLAWFALTGVLNGGAMLLMYSALSMAPVALVAPIVASYPLVTALVSVIVLPHEVLTVRTVAGAMVTVAGVVYLVASSAGA